MREDRAMSVGERLEMARKMRGMSQQELGDQVGVSRMSISKYENNQNIPVSQHLLKLAQALDIKVEYLLRPVEVHLSAPVFRKKTALSKKQEKKILHLTQDWVERYLQIEALFGIDSKFEEPPIEANVQQMEDIEDIAICLRENWQLGLDPIDNMMEVLEERGIKVWAIDQEVDRFDAVVMWANEQAPVFVVKEGISGDRQRYNLAHELGHLILRISEDLDEEKVAHRFAGAFLVPEPKAYEELGRFRQHISYEELILLKHKYGLSMQAWTYRAKDLGVISESKMRSMFIDFGKRGWREKEPGDQILPEQPRKMNQLILRALAEGVISRSRAEELLNTPLQELEIMEV